MRGIPALIAFGVVAAALAVSGQPEPKPAEAAPVAHDYSADIARLQGELDTLKAERDELRAYAEARDAAARKYRDAHDRLLLKQSSVTPAVAPPVSAPRAVTYVSAGARGVCANGSCGTASRAQVVRYAAAPVVRVRQRESFRPLRRLFGR